MGGRAETATRRPRASAPEAPNGVRASAGLSPTCAQAQDAQRRAPDASGAPTHGQRGGAELSERAQNPRGRLDALLGLVLGTESYHQTPKQSKNLLPHDRSSSSSSSDSTWS